MAIQETSYYCHFQNVVQGNGNMFTQDSHAEKVSEISTKAKKSVESSGALQLQSSLIVFQERPVLPKEPLSLT
ncbi:unnamed protein product [Arabidopsis halleri]